MTKLEVVGGVLAVVASIISNLGVNIQKYSHVTEARAPRRLQRPYVQRPLWWFGLTLVVVGSIGDFSAFGFATQSLVAALGGGTTLISNVATAYWMNHEAPRLTDLGGVFFVLVGVVLIAYVSKPNVDYPLPELEQRFLRKEFLVYISIVGVCTLSMLATIKGSLANKLKNQMSLSNKKQKQQMKQFDLRLTDLENRLLSMEEKLLQPTSSRESSSDISDTSEAAAESFKYHAMRRYSSGVKEDEVPNRVPYYYAISSGIVGAISVLLAKCSAIMIALSIEGDNQFKYKLTYVFIGGMLISILIQTHFLNLATSLGDIMTVFPVFQAVWITFSVVGGAVFYDTDQAYSRREYIVYPLALLSIAAGVTLLVQHKSSHRRDMEEDEITGFLSGDEYDSDGEYAKLVNTSKL